MYRLRWYFDYLDRKPYFGCWGIADPARPAWCHAFEGIARAIIQGKDINGNIKNLADCPGQDFMNFSWMAEARIGALNLKKSIKLPSKIVGIMMQTRYGQIKVYNDGTVLTDKNVYDTINFSTYGR